MAAVEQRRPHVARIEQEVGRISKKFQPKLEGFEDRVVPAALSFRFADGTVGSALFSTPAGVDPAWASQTLDVTDLVVVTSGQPYTVNPGATATYQYGMLVGVAGSATGPGPNISVSGTTATATDTATGATYTAPIALDGANTQETFTLPDGVVGAISYNIPWASVDPDQASQTLTLANFNLNIAGRNLGYGGATVRFEYGQFMGVDFAIDTSALANFPYTSVSMTGLNVAAQTIGGPLFQVQAKAAPPFLQLDFSPTTAGAYVLTVEYELKGGTTNSFALAVLVGSTPESIRNLVARALKDEGLNVDKDGATQLIVQGKGMADDDQIKSLKISGNAARYVPPKLVGSRGRVTYN